MRISFGLEDGYAGAARPHSVEVDDEELAECQTFEEAVCVVDEAIREWIETHIYPYWDRDQIEDAWGKNLDDDAA